MYRLGVDFAFAAKSTVALWTAKNLRSDVRSHGRFIAREGDVER
jgi:hypothetical protein